MLNQPKPFVLAGPGLEPLSAETRALVAEAMREGETAAAYGELASLMDRQSVLQGLVASRFVDKPASVVEDVREAVGEVVDALKNPPR